MQNRFKFRFWFKDTQEMIYSEKFNDVQVLGQWLFEDRKDVVKMQSTGLKDKNGKLIYEGDILKLAEFSKPVEVKHRALGFVLRREPSNTVGYDNDKYIPEDCEVIGNIYENKELLNEI